MLEIMEEIIWFGHKLQRVVIFGENAERVPCHILWPKARKLPTPFIIATHGATSSKHEWTELDGYTKGGNLSRELLELGVAIIAMDWHYHGENNTQDLMGRNVFQDEHFEDFFLRSVADALAVVTYAQSNDEFDRKRMGFSGYSLAGMFGIWLANHGVDIKAMILCVPGVDRGGSKYYSSVNNLGNLNGTAILQISAEKDEYIDFKDSLWFFDTIPVSKKKFLSFKSGHSLPLDYVGYVSEWIKDELI